jgi:hypothetical protein
MDVEASGWNRYPATLEFGEHYLCACPDGTVFREILTAGDPRHSAKWRQVGWVLPFTSIPKPPKEDDRQ